MRRKVKILNEDIETVNPKESLSSQDLEGMHIESIPGMKAGNEMENENIPQRVKEIADLFEVVLQERREDLKNKGLLNDEGKLIITSDEIVSKIKEEDEEANKLIELINEYGGKNIFDKTNEEDIQALKNAIAKFNGEETNEEEYSGETGFENDELVKTREELEEMEKEKEEYGESKSYNDKKLIDNIAKEMNDLGV